MSSRQPPPLSKPVTSQILTLSPSALSESHHLQPLFTLCNIAFDHHAQHGHPTKKFLHRGRFIQPSDMISELGTDPNAFCMLAFSSPSPRSDGQGEDENGARETVEEVKKGPEIIGTISAKPFAESTSEPAMGPDGHPRLLFKRPPPANREQAALREDTAEEEGTGAARWELLIMAVVLEVKGKGLASLLMERCVEEIKRRVRLGVESLGSVAAAATAPSSGDPLGKAGEGEPTNGNDTNTKQKPTTPTTPTTTTTPSKIILYLSTLQELNETYYQRRGWRTTGVRRFEAGTAGSRDGFGVVEMVRVV